jgi:DNA-binding transcriptional MerR regulator
MNNVALANINTLLPSEQQGNVQPSEPVFVLSSTQLQGAIQKATMPLLQDLKDLRQEVQRLKDAKPGITSLRVDDAFEAIEQIDQHLARIDQVRLTAPPQGSKTLARITKIDEILKTRGSTTLKELERILKIRPQEMSRIIARLDKRRYEIFLRDGDEREKVLRLRAQIR